MRHGGLQHLQQIDHLPRVLKLSIELLVLEEYGCALYTIQGDWLLSNFHDYALLTRVIAFCFFLRCLGAR